MFRSLWTRGMYALVALTLLLTSTAALAQNRIGFIEAPEAVDAVEEPMPAVLDAPQDAQRISQQAETVEPETLDLDESEIDYTFDPSTVGKSGGCDNCGGDCGCNSGCNRCDCKGRGCHHCGRLDLFGCIHRMMSRSHAERHGQCGESHGTCLGKPMTYAEGTRHDPNRTVAASGQLFQQYYTQGPAAIPAQMYVAPYPVPAAVGHTYITYQAFEPHQFMYRHKRAYTRRHGASGGTTTTRIYWW